MAVSNNRRRAETQSPALRTRQSSFIFLTVTGDKKSRLFLDRSRRTRVHATNMLHFISTPRWEAERMRQLLYVSNTALEIGLNDLDQVLTASRRNNAMMGIT